VQCTISLFHPTGSSRVVCPEDGLLLCPQVPLTLLNNGCQTSHLHQVWQTLRSSHDPPWQHRIVPRSHRSHFGSEQQECQPLHGWILPSQDVPNTFPKLAKNEIMVGMLNHKDMLFDFDSTNINWNITTDANWALIIQICLLLLL